MPENGCFHCLRPLRDSDPQVMMLGDLAARWSSAHVIKTVATDIVTMAVKDLKPAPYNPRRIDPSSLAALGKSIDRFGVVEPMILNRRSGFVVGGHQRLKILRSKKVATTPVVVVDLDETEERALNVALNSTKLTGEFTGALHDLLAELKLPTRRFSVSYASMSY